MALMRVNADETIKIKASGGIRDLATFMDMVEKGADRIGTSAGVAIDEEAAGE